MIHLRWLAAWLCLAEPEPDIDLSGTWYFELDPNDQGVQERWFARGLAQRIRLPGSLQSQGFGEEVSPKTKWTGSIVDRSFFTSPRYAKYREPGNIKYPCWLQPEKYYTGAAWYQREIQVPPNWNGRRIALTLERPHWETRVWLGEREIGSRDSLSTPHVYDLGAAVPPGRHRLTIRVDNRMIVNVGPNSHSVSDHTQSNWNGIVGRLTLSSHPKVRLEDVQIHPDVPRRAALVRVKIGNAAGMTAKGTLKLAARSSSHQAPPKTVDLGIAESGGAVQIDYPLGAGAPLWDEFHPVLHRLTVELEAAAGGDRFSDRTEVSFGLRSFTAEGTQFAINGRKTFIRGTLECAIFPLTGYPPCDVEGWKKVLRAAKDHGLNALRFHSWCPPEAAFQAGDELGFYYQVECASWANSGSSVGDGLPVDAWLYAEAERILRAYGNHPSFVMMAYGNEPAGKNQKAWLGKWVNHWKERDPRRVYTSGAGWPEIPENQYHNIPGPRIQAWGEGLRSRINARPPETRTDYSSWVRQRPVPIVSHEIGQWCVYPNFEEMKKYTGVLKPRNFEIFRDFLEANHMGDQARDFLLASGKLQTLCYKEDIESALRTPGFGGFHLLDLHDFPGQGTALVGVLDPFWEPKGYVTPGEFRRFCNSTVPLTRMGKRYWTVSETFRADVEVAHFGPGPIEEAVVWWRLAGPDGRAAASGGFPSRTIPVGNGIQLGTVEIPLEKCAPAKKHTLVVGIQGTSFENDWDIWIFPDRLDAGPPRDVLVSENLDDTALERLKAGGKVLLLAPPRTIRSNVAVGFSTVFWNTAWTRNQPPHTLGILCDPEHPVFALFPTEFHSNWQWWELMHGSAAMVLDETPPALRPLVQLIDTWFEARRLGLLFEASVLGGKLMVASMDLSTDLDRRLVARQMRHSILNYMGSDRFRPGVDLSIECLRRLFKDSSSASKARADSEAPGYEAARAVDGDPATIWHTRWEPSAAPMPHFLVLDLGREIGVKGLTYLPRQDMDNGRIAEYEIHASMDGASWGEPVAAGRWSNDASKRTVHFKRPVRARYVRLTARSEVNGNAFASAAEVEALVE